MRLHRLLPLALVLVPTLACAGTPITGFPNSQPFGSEPLNDAGLPVPSRATAISARYTLFPVGAGALMMALGSLGGSSSEQLTTAPLVSAAGFSVAAAGIVAGPSAGYAYGRIPRRGTTGILLRAGLVAVPTVLLASAPGVHENEDEAFAIVVGMSAGLVLASVAAAYDVKTVGRLVREHNAAAGVPTSWRLEPCVTPLAHAPGLALRAGF